MKPRIQKIFADQRVRNEWRGDRRTRWGYPLRLFASLSQRSFSPRHSFLLCELCARSRAVSITDAVEKAKLIL